MHADKKIHDRRKREKLFLSLSLKLIKNNQTTYKVPVSYRYSAAQNEFGGVIGPHSYSANVDHLCLTVCFRWFIVIRI